jgi:MoxR-like ATPase
MTALSNDARTILRSRVRRHPDVDKQIPQGTVSQLPNADLSQVAVLLGLDLPRPDELRMFADIKAQGMTGARALRALDLQAHGLGFGGRGLAAILAADKDDARGDANAEADDAEDDAAQPALPLEAEAEAEAATDADDMAKAIEAEFTLMQQQMGACMAVGDLKPYQAALRDIIERAHKPAPAPVMLAAPYDTSKVEGHVPTITGRKTMKQAGIKATSLANDAATALNVYDAPDAPRIDPAYVWPDMTAPIMAALARGRNAMVYGPAGTGKTEFAMQLAAVYRRPFVRISCDDQTEAATLIGTPAFKDGSSFWQDGQLAKAIRKPGTIILIDEPTVARAGALFVLQAVMDGNRALHVADTGEVIPVAPDVLFIMADNTNGTGDETGQYEATRRLNRATLDRLALTVRLDYLAPDVEATVLASRTGCSPRTAAALCKFAQLTRRNADVGKLSHGLGLRRLMALAEQITDGVPPSIAFQLSVLETMPYDDREPLRQMWSADVKADTFK